jgi:hypothetical protein
MVDLRDKLMFRQQVEKRNPALIKTAASLVALPVGA